MMTAYLSLPILAWLGQGPLPPRLVVSRSVGRCGATRCDATATVGAAALAGQLERVASWAGKTVVIKYGGHAMTDAALAESFATDCALLQRLGLRLVVVHGGGPQIGAMLKRLEIPSNFVDGLRVTDSATMEVAEMVLCGMINKQIASSITRAGGRAVGLSGKDDALVRAAQKNPALGLVGEPRNVRTELLESLLDGGVLPVIAPVAVGDEGASYNVNADTMAGAVATALGASCLLLLTDVAGVLDGQMHLLPTLTLEDVSRRGPAPSHPRRPAASPPRRPYPTRHLLLPRAPPTCATTRELPPPPTWQADRGGRYHGRDDPQARDCHERCERRRRQRGSHGRAGAALLACPLLWRGRCWHVGRRQQVTVER